MSSKAGVREIIAAHLRTLRNAQSNRARIQDYLEMFGVPACAACGMLWVSELNQNIATMIATSVSIFGALLFNFLILVYELMNRTGGRTIKTPSGRELLRQTFKNTAFCIVVCIAALVCSFGSYFVHPETHTMHCFSWATYFLFGVLIMTMLMVLKRIVGLIQSEAPRGEGSLESGDAVGIVDRSMAHDPHTDTPK